MIRAKDVVFRYSDQGRAALDGVSMEVRRGEFVAVLGANGCGKSTLAKHFNAILLPEQGEVFVEQYNTKEEEHLYDIRQRVGMVFQNPDNQIVATVVEEDVAFALENLGVPAGRDAGAGGRGHGDGRHLQAPQQGAAQAVRRAETAGGHRGGHRDAAGLSGDGRVHRHARPDRPRKGDADGRSGSTDEFGITVVMITHYMEEAVQADRVIVMSGGRIELEGTPQAGLPGQRADPGAQAGRAAGQGTLRSAAGGGHPDLDEEIISEEECAQALAAAAVRRGPGKKIADRRSQGPEPGRQRAGCQPHGGGPLPETGGNMASVIKVEHLTYIYGEGMPDATRALDDISFEIEQGEFLGVIGPTGCGKSTLITHFNGLNRPTSGRLLIDGEDIWADPKQIRQYRFKVGLVFQYPEYQLFEETVRKDIAFGPAQHGPVRRGDRTAGGRGRALLRPGRVDAGPLSL